MFIFKFGSRVDSFVTIALNLYRDEGVKPPDADMSTPNASTPSRRLGINAPESRSLPYNAYVEFQVRKKLKAILFQSQLFFYQIYKEHNSIDT